MENLKNREITLETERLVIKTLLPGGVTSLYVQGMNDPDVYKYLLISNKGKQKAATIKAYVSENFNNPHAVLFGIYTKYENELIGTIRLSGISRFHYCCDIGTCIFSKSRWGKGFAREAVKEVVKFAFFTLGLHYIEAGVFSENISSINLFRNSGFQVRNTYTDKLRLGDTFAEVTILYSINSKFDYSKLNFSRKS